MFDILPGFFALAMFLTGEGARVSFVRLPDMSGLAKIGLDDFLKKEGTLWRYSWDHLERIQLDDPRLHTLVAWHQRWRAKHTRPTEKPSIDSTIGDLPTATKLAWQAVERANNPPFLFRRGGLPVRIEDDEHGMPVIRELSADRLRHDLSNAANYFKPGAPGEPSTAARPQKDVCINMLAGSEIPLPGLARLVTAPVYTPDWRLLQVSGYDPASQILVNLGKLIIPPVPPVPTDTDCATAKDLILELLQDISFEENADRTNAVGLLLCPFVREAIPGHTPLHFIEAPEIGSGKGLLGKVLLLPFLGSSAPVTPESKSDDEWRKKITSSLRADRPCLFLDNLSAYLDSPSLAAVLTTEIREDRLLGVNEILSLPVRLIFIGTGNNVGYSGEIARRICPIRLNPRVEQPWRRSGFRHPKLTEWVLSRRADFMYAALVLIQSWLATGRPVPEGLKPLESFVRWSETIGGILAHAGFSGFMTNVDRLYESADLESAAWRDFVRAWWEDCQSRDVGIGDLYPIAVGIDGFPLGKATSERGQRTALGRALRKTGLRPRGLSNHGSAHVAYHRAVEADPGARQQPEAGSGSGVTTRKRS